MLLTNLEKSEGPTLIPIFGPDENSGRKFGRFLQIPGTVNHPPWKRARSYMNPFDLRTANSQVTLINNASQPPKDLTSYYGDLRMEGAKSVRKIFCFSAIGIRGFSLTFQRGCATDSSAGREAGRGAVLGSVGGAVVGAMSDSEKKEMEAKAVQTAPPSGIRGTQYGEIPAS